MAWWRVEEVAVVLKNNFVAPVLFSAKYSFLALICFLFGALIRSIILK
jgi:hypothetical protein